MKKTMLNTAVLLLLSLGVSACSVSAGSGSQGDPITRTSLNSTTNTSNATEESSSSDGEETSEENTNTATSEENSNTATSEENTNTATSEENTNTATSEESSSNEISDETTSGESSEEVDLSENVETNEEADSAEKTEDTNSEESNEQEITSEETSEETTSTDNVNEIENIIAKIDGVSFSGSYAETYLTNVEAQNTLAEQTEKMANELTGSCMASSGNSASSYRCSVGSIEEGEVFAAYNIKDSNNQILGGYAVVREAYSDRENPTNSYLAMIRTPTIDKSVVVNATYNGQASYSTNNRPNMATYPFELIVSGDNVNGAIYNTAGGTGNRVNRAVFNTGVISATDESVNFNGTVTFNNNYFSGLGDITGYYQGSFVGENAEGVIGTFGTKEQGSMGSAQGVFAGTK